MRILTVGGGSGGHVTPVLAVINELSRLDSSLQVMFVCDKQFESQSRGLMAQAVIPVKVSTITSGKLRRYHGVPLWKQMSDLPTVGRNLVDMIKVGIGVVESLYLLWNYRPDAVFAKGGYVCLPLGYAAHLLRIPLVIHDSDSRPGLTNRILGRWATAIGTGTPLENYSYPKDRTHYVGVPIGTNFHPLRASEQLAAKAAIGMVDIRKPLIVVTGGGLGAKTINDAILRIAPTLLEEGRGIYHITGKKHFEACEKKAPHHAEYHLLPFVYKDMVDVLGAADVVISRGSATFLQELAALKKPTIIVPGAQLSDQIKNAEVFKKAQAAEVLSDSQLMADPSVLLSEIDGLLEDTKRAQNLAEHLYNFAKPDAALDVAKLIIEAAAAGKRHLS